MFPGQKHLIEIHHTKGRINQGFNNRLLRLILQAASQKDNAAGSKIIPAVIMKI